MLANSFLRTEKGLVSYLKVGFRKKTEIYNYESHKMSHKISVPWGRA